MSVENYDLIVRGGRVVDGAGGEPFNADVAVREGRIAAVGRVMGHGYDEIDARDMIVTPGFVDVHTHYDGQITWENRLAPSSGHGVTTVVMGNCGVGFAPVRSGDQGLVIRLMEGVEDIPDVVMAEGVPFNWESFPDYLDALAKRPADIDFCAQLPHSPLRVFVMGERGLDQPPTEGDLAEMRRLTAEAVRAGAMGVTSSRNLFHRFRTGAHAPSVKTPEDELIALAHGLHDAGAGVFQCNPDLSKSAEEEMALFRRLARASGQPLNFTLTWNPAWAENWRGYIAELTATAEEGLPIRGQFIPRPVGMLFGLDLSFHPFSLNPSYRALADLPLAEKVRRMRDPELRARLIAEKPEDPNAGFVAIAEMARNFVPLSDPVDYHATGTMTARTAERLGRPELEVIYDALLGDGGRAILWWPANMITDYLALTVPLFGMDNAVIALGDGGAHYGLLCDASYPSYLLTQRLGRDGLDLPRLIRLLSTAPAASLGLHDRGVIAPGYKADLNVIDLDDMELRRPTVRCDLPAGGKRLVQRASGYAATIVSGVVTYRDGQPTAQLPGRLVRGAQPAPRGYRGGKSRPRKRGRSA
jgi:N-acyl-D-aspartate/D-glutamate deacylase